MPHLQSPWGHWLWSSRRAGDHKGAGCLTWMGRGSVPSSPQRAARGCPKSGLLQPEPACPGAWAVAGLRRRAKGQGSPLLLLLLLLSHLLLWSTLLALLLVLLLLLCLALPTVLLCL